jgi:hypothetical protein
MTQRVSWVYKTSNHLDMPNIYWNLQVILQVLLPMGRFFHTIIDVDDWNQTFTCIWDQVVMTPLILCSDSGPVYTTVEKSTGHEKKGVSQLWLVKMQLLTGGCLH